MSSSKSSETPCNAYLRSDAVQQVSLIVYTQCQSIDPGVGIGAGRTLLNVDFLHGPRNDGPVREFNDLLASNVKLAFAFWELPHESFKVHVSRASTWVYPVVRLVRVYVIAYPVNQHIVVHCSLSVAAQRLDVCLTHDFVNLLTHCAKSRELRFHRYAVLRVVRLGCRTDDRVCLLCRLDLSCTSILIAKTNAVNNAMLSRQYATRVVRVGQVDSRCQNNS